MLPVRGFWAKKAVSPIPGGTEETCPPGIGSLSLLLVGKMLETGRPKALPPKTKKPRTPSGSRLFWSCWADLNRRPHPYQKYNVCFAGYPFVPFHTPKSLWHKAFPAKASCPVLPGFSLFVGRLLEILRCKGIPCI